MKRANEWLESDSENIYEAEEIILELVNRLEATEKVVEAHSDFLSEIVQFGYVQCTAHDEGNGCYLIAAKEFDNMRETLKEYKDKLV